jgi:hypothetical protein
MSGTGRFCVNGAPFLAALRYSRPCGMASPPLTLSLVAGASADGESRRPNKEAGVLGIKDVASYSDFFSPEGWHAI